VSVFLEKMFRYTGALSLILAIAVPYLKLPVIEIPLHPSVFILAGACLWYFNVIGFRWFSLLIVLFLFLVSVISALYSAAVGLQFSLASWSYKLLPLLGLGMSFTVCSSSNLKCSQYRLILFWIASIFIIISVLQFAPPAKSFFISLGYLTEDRAEVWNSYYMLLAPMANPNNSAAVSAALALSILVSWGAIKEEAQTKVLFVIIFFALAILMFLGYARTVFAAFSLSVSFWVIFRTSWPAKLGAFFLLLASLLSLGFFEFRETAYYFTVFSALSDSSFVARFEFWEVLVSILNKYPIAWLVGLGRVQDTLIAATGESFIDSSYLFVVAQFGVFVLGGLLLFAVYLSVRSFSCFIIVVFILICSITMAIFSDVRLTIIFGGLLGYAYSFSKKSRSKIDEFTS